MRFRKAKKGDFNPTLSKKRAKEGKKNWGIEKIDVY